MLLTRCVNIIICHLAMIARVCQFYCLCICAPVYLFMCVRCELCLDVVHGVSVAIKWQISYNLVMFARIEAHQSTRRRALGGGAGKRRSSKRCRRMSSILQPSNGSNENILSKNYPFEWSNKMFAHGSSSNNRKGAGKKHDRHISTVYKNWERAQINRFGYKTTFT